MNILSERFQRRERVPVRHGLRVERPVVACRPLGTVFFRGQVERRAPGLALVGVNLLYDAQLEEFLPGGLSAFRLRAIRHQGADFRKTRIASGMYPMYNIMFRFGFLEITF